MLELEAALDAPATARYHREAIEQIVQCVEERIYCALLGPRLCGKTLLLRYIEGNLAKLLGWTCVYLDLLAIRATTQQAFFNDLIHLTARRIAEETGKQVPVPEAQAASSAVFRGFLASCLEVIGGDLVLIFDPLEALPTDLVQALLTSLRAAYMDQQTLDRQVTVVVSGALSLATLTVGESSPFRGIARRIFVGDLSTEDSQELLLEVLEAGGVSATRPAFEKLLLATSGDIYLIHHIGQRCAELAQTRSPRRLRSGAVTQIIERFLREEVLRYAPLIEAVRLVEEDPDLLQCVLMILDRDSVPRVELPLPLSPDLDPLYLTGVVEIAEGDRYRLQNSIYRHFLAQHFTPGRVGHVLAMVGRWDAALDYLEDSLLQGNWRSYGDLLPAAINSMYAAQDLVQAVHFLRRGLAAAFGVSDSHVWISSSQDDRLQVIGPADAHGEGEAWTDLEISIREDRLEARAYRQQSPLRGLEGDRRIVRAIPLVIPGSRPIGIVTLYDDPFNGAPGRPAADRSADPFGEQRDREFQLAGFLNQASRALQTVSLRRQELALAGRVQASLLPEIPQEAGWEIAAAWRPARETSGDFYDFIRLPDGRLAIVIADVVDKGMGPALLMTLSRTLLRSHAADYLDHPEALLEAVNRRIIADLDAGLFVTLFYGLLDPASGTLTYCNAGHPPPYLVSGERRAAPEALYRTGMPLGVSEDSRWTRERVYLPPGGTLLLYTDGVLDAENAEGEFFGQERVQELLGDNFNRRAAEVQETLLAALYTFAGGEPQIDDLTLVVLRRDS